MKITETGLVLKEVKLREADRILTLLMPEHGIVSVSARGSMRPNNKLFSASGLFCFSEWTLREGKTMYSVDEAAPIEVFFGLRQSLEAVSLAAYLAELVQILLPTGQEAEILLRLVLNSFYLLSENKHSPVHVKSVFELRALAESGYLPDFSACIRCGREDGLDCFDFSNGGLLCEKCRTVYEREANLTPGVLAAARHIVECPAEKAFSFTLKEDAELQLGVVAEQYLLHQFDYPPKTLSFLKTLF